MLASATDLESGWVGGWVEEEQEAMWAFGGWVGGWVGGFICSTA